VSIRAYADNVVLRLEPQQAETKSGLAIVHASGPKARGYRTAVVVAVGPGHHEGCKHCGCERRVFVPTAVKVGERVIVDSLAGQNYDMDLTVTRANKAPEFDSFADERGHFRIVREAEILAVVDDASAEVAA
jgi:co-chaperonin GroES (HSP10)